MQPRHGVDGGVDITWRGAGRVDLEVQVGPGGVPGGADVADVLARGHLLPRGDVDSGCPHVDVGGGQGGAVDVVFDDDDPAARFGVLGASDGAVGGERADAGIGAFPDAQRRQLPGEVVRLREMTTDVGPVPAE